MTDNTQPAALRLANEFRLCNEYDSIPSIIDIAKAEAELRRQHARIADLEAQLEAIGAGGVSGPLMGQPQAMPDLSALTERGAKAWAGVDAQGLREGRWYMVNKDSMATLCADQADAEQSAKDAQALWPHMGPHRAVQLVEASEAGFTAADMATASAQGFRDGAVSAMAGEPVAWMTFTEEGDPDMVFLDRLEACQYCEDDDPPKPLYLAAPPAAQAEVENLRKALQFYADKEHFAIAEEGAWDTVSGEPQNYWCDEAGTAMVEDGSIAKMALAGQLINFSDEDEDESAPPTSAEGVEHG